jgi:fucose permease
VPTLLLACAAYLSVALPSSTLGLLWPSMRLSFGEPVGALGILLVFGITASVISSVATGRTHVRTGPLVAAGAMLTAAALAVEAFAPSLRVMAVGFVLFGLGFGAIDAALNAHAARHFGARDINWMHASYGLGATIGPLVVTALLAGGLGWRRTYGFMALAQAVLACAFTVRRRGWPESSHISPAGEDKPAPEQGTARRKPSAAAALTFTAVETGIESGAGIWGYIFLTAGRGLAPETAGVAVSAYWAMMFAGRVVLGPVAQRLGPARVLAAAVAGIPAGAVLMTAPGPGLLAIIGLMTLGLAAAPVFPLLTLMTPRWSDSAAGTTRMVSLQVAASAIGSAALPAGLGLAIGAVNARILAPSLLVLGLAMGGLYALLSRWSGAWPLQLHPGRSAGRSRSADNERAVHAHLGMAGHGADVLVGSRGISPERDGARPVSGRRRVADQPCGRAADGGLPGLAEVEWRLLVRYQPAVCLVGVGVDELDGDL